MSTEIHRREDTNPDQGEKEYGNVHFADPVNNKYPIDTADHIYAAWRYIHHQDNAAKYKVGEVTLIKDRILYAAKKRNIELSVEDS